MISLYFIYYGIHVFREHKLTLIIPKSDYIPAKDKAQAVYFLKRELLDQHPEYASDEIKIIKCKPDDFWNIPAFREQINELYRKLNFKHRKSDTTMYTIEFYSKKKYFRPRQHYWRAKHANGQIITTGGEGYYNQNECFNACMNFIQAVQQNDYINKVLN
jgi:uncharacterized protein YegP (UPF0339 family)